MSKKDSLTHERLCELLHYNPDTGVFTRKKRQNNRMKIGDVAGSESDGYIQLAVDGASYKAHRLAWFYTHKTWPQHVIDHINGVKLDNRICNLRDVTHRVNCQNRTRSPSHSSLDFLGVTKDARPQMKSVKYVSQINIDGEHIYLGRFDSPEEAHIMHLMAKIEFHDGCVAEGDRY